MKRKNKILVTMKALTLAAAVATMLVSPSCQKETVGDSAGNVADGVRVISVQFDNSTKATLSGVHPTFTNNDKIRVSNSEKSEECTVTVSGTSATFTTTLSGELTAIYPADAADYTGNGPISSQAFKVPAIQTGKVEDAIIAKATIAGNIATFTGVTALFEITPPSTAKIITVTSLEKVESGSRTGTAADINTENTGKTVITVGDDSADLPETIYVALVPGVNLTDLSFDAGEDIGLKGIPTSKLGTGPDETAAKAKYTIDGTNWHPYVTIGGKKWATENIGATDTDPYGTYFMWGETNGIKPSSASSFSFPLEKYYTADNNSWTQSSGFNWANCPWTNGTYDASNKNVFTKYINSDEYASGTADNKTKLDLADDAAYANWGGPWRMPTGGTDANADFTALANTCKSDGYISGNITATSIAAKPESQGVYYYNGSGTKGVYFVDENKNTLFFPAVGYGYGTSLSNAGFNGDYWSSSLYAHIYAYYVRFLSSTRVYPQYTDLRCYGRSVRPVAD